MAKDAYYFSHDSNARQDPKILGMRSIYGSEGYGWYWIIIEMLREQHDYKVKINKYVWNAIAMQLQCTPEKAKSFVEDCINEFELLVTDAEYFWSKSLLIRMIAKDEKSENAKKAAEARWSKDQSHKASKQSQTKRNAVAMHSHSKSNANKEEESKEEESKEEEISNPTENLEVIKNQLRLLTIECGLKGVGIDGLETIYTYIGQVEPEVIEKAIKKAEKKHVPYFVTIINGWIEEGKTTAESINPVSKVGDRDGNQGDPRGPTSSTDPRPDSLSSRFTKK
jgi:hypothetical protein